jgi:AcrR family transcriptional regulator
MTKLRKTTPPRATGLSRERIVEAALQLVEDESLAGFSTRKLGERLGCEAMSIYHHFPSKRHLLDALVDHAIASVQMPARELDPEQRLRAMLASYRAMARRWPALYQLIALHRLNTPTGVRMIDAVLRVIRELAPDDETAARSFRAVGYYLTGACLDETAGYARGPSAAEPVDDAFIARECPHLMAAAPFFDARHWDATFEFGVDALLAGLRPAPAAPKPGARAGRGKRR